MVIRTIINGIVRYKKVMFQLKFLKHSFSCSISFSKTLHIATTIAARLDFENTFNIFIIFKGARAQKIGLNSTYLNI